MSRRSVEIESLAAFDAAIGGVRSLAGWFVQSVDLREREPQLRSLDPQGSVFLGCPLTESSQRWLADHGALLFPTLPDLPFDPYRASLYDAEELLGAAAGYPDSLDARVYGWARANRGGRHGAELGRTLAVALHDHAVGDALDDLLAPIDPTTVVGVMGGHALRRGEAGYRAAAGLGRALARGGCTVLTGGGPGAMEAANLGAWCSPAPESTLTDAIDRLAEVATFRPSVAAWVAGALRVRRGYAGPTAATIGIPTWFYGHEPPNAFATAIAKYFGNALREDSLLTRCRGGLVVLPGAAGTVQEIFQAGTETYYAAERADVVSIVLVGRQQWTEELPAWPLLQRLARDRPMGHAVHLVDSVEEAAALLTPPTGSVTHRWPVTHR